MCPPQHLEIRVPAADTLWGEFGSRMVLGQAGQAFPGAEDAPGKGRGWGVMLAGHSTWGCLSPCDNLVLTESGVVKLSASFCLQLLF